MKVRSRGDEIKEARIAECEPGFLNQERRKDGGSSPGEKDTLGSVALNSPPFCFSDPLAAPMRVKQMIGNRGAVAWDICGTIWAHFHPDEPLGSRISTHSPPSGRFRAVAEPPIASEFRRTIQCPMPKLPPRLQRGRLSGPL